MRTLARLGMGFSARAVAMGPWSLMTGAGGGVGGVSMAPSDTACASNTNELIVALP